MVQWVAPLFLLEFVTRGDPGRPSSTQRDARTRRSSHHGAGVFQTAEVLVLDLSFQTSQDMVQMHSLTFTSRNASPEGTIIRVWMRRLNFHSINRCTVLINLPFVLPGCEVQY